MVVTLSLGTGRTAMLQGMVHRVILADYLFTTIVPKGRGGADAVSGH